MKTHPGYIKSGEQDSGAVPLTNFVAVFLFAGIVCQQRIAAPVFTGPVIAFQCVNQSGRDEEPRCRSVSDYPDHFPEICTEGVCERLIVMSEAVFNVEMGVGIWS